MFEVCRADNPRLTVRAAAIVDEWKLLQSQDTMPPTCKLEGGGRSHAADADNDDIISRVCHTVSSKFQVPSFNSQVPVYAILILYAVLKGHPELLTVRSLWCA